MAGDLINYQYPAIADGVSQMRRVNNDIRDQVSSLRKQVQELRSAFTGATSDAYEASSTKIAQDLTQSNEQLDTLAASVSKGSDQMAGADRSQAGRFNGR